MTKRWWRGEGLRCDFRWQQEPVWRVFSILGWRRKRQRFGRKAIFFLRSNCVLLSQRRIAANTFPQETLRSWNNTRTSYAAFLNYLRCRCKNSLKQSGKVKTKPCNTADVQLIPIVHNAVYCGVVCVCVTMQAQYCICFWVRLLFPVYSHVLLCQALPSTFVVEGAFSSGFFLEMGGKSHWNVVGAFDRVKSILCCLQLFLIPPECNWFGGLNGFASLLNSSERL